MEVNGAPKQPDNKHSSEYLPLCSAEQRHSYRFGSTWGWVNDDRIFIFGCTVSLNGSIGLPSGCKLSTVTHIKNKVCLLKPSSSGDVYECIWLGWPYFSFHRENSEGRIETGGLLFLRGVKVPTRDHHSQNLTSIQSFITGRMQNLSIKAF